jgi:xylan 1,4-beta-xylosidase
MFDETNSLVTKRGDRAIVAALWNYAEPGEKARPLVFRLKILHGSAAKYRVQFVDAAHANALAAWGAMGQPEWPTLSQIAALKKASALAPPEERRLGEPISIEPQGLALVTIDIL